VVEATHVLGGQEDRHTLMLRSELVGDALALQRVEPTGHIGPADPEALVTLVVGAQAGRDTADAAPEVQLAFAAFDGDGQAVGDDQQSAHGTPGAARGTSAPVAGPPRSGGVVLQRVFPKRQKRP
jgi:hypothetical protein